MNHYGFLKINRPETHQILAIISIIFHTCFKSAYKVAFQFRKRISHIYIEQNGTSLNSEFSHRFLQNNGRSYHSSLLPILLRIHQKIHTKSPQMSDKKVWRSHVEKLYSRLQLCCTDISTIWWSIPFRCQLFQHKTSRKYLLHQKSSFYYHS
jgi:hypothetical protein